MWDGEQGGAGAGGTGAAWGSGSPPPGGSRPQQPGEGVTKARKVHLLSQPLVVDRAIRLPKVLSMLKLTRKVPDMHLMPSVPLVTLAKSTMWLLVRSCRQRLDSDAIAANDNFCIQSHVPRLT